MREVGNIFPVYHHSFSDGFAGLEQALFLGIMERRPDGFYFVPDAGSISGTSVHKYSRQNHKNGVPSKSTKKLKPNSEVLEVFDVERNPLASIMLRD